MQSIKSARTITEEVFNSAIHGFGAFAGIVGLIIGLTAVQMSGSFRAGFIVYGASLIVLMTASSLYHALMFTKSQKVFGIIDHSGIFILIAGSFTPFVVRLYTGWAQVMLLFIVWSIAILGIVIKAALPRFAKKIGVVPYIGFGWLGLMFVPIIHMLSTPVLYLLLAGGLLYTIGVGLLVTKKPFMHAGWHMFVLAAAVAHYFAILKLA